eukprot:Rmarinus@m.9312
MTSRSVEIYRKTLRNMPLRRNSMALTSASLCLPQVPGPLLCSVRSVFPRLLLQQAIYTGSFMRADSVDASSRGSSAWGRPTFAATSQRIVMSSLAPPWGCVSCSSSTRRPRGHMKRC